MALSRGALVFIATIAVVVGLSYALDAPSWFDSGRPQGPPAQLGDERAAAGPDASDEAPEADEQPRAAPPGLARQALVRSRIEPAASEPAEAVASEEQAGRGEPPAKATDDASAEQRTPKTKPPVEAAAGAPSEPRPRAPSTAAVPEPPPAKVEGQSGRTVARLEGNAGRAPPGRQEPGAPERDARAAPAPAAAGGSPRPAPTEDVDEAGTPPEDRLELANRDEQAGTTSAAASSSASPAGGDRVLDQGGGLPAAEPAEAEGPPEADLEVERAALDQPEEPQDQGWGDFGIAMLQRSFDRLFGRDDPEARSGGSESQAEPEPSRPPAAAIAADRAAEPPTDAPPPITSKSEETIRQAVRAMSAADDPVPEPAAGPDDADLESPSFDIVRVEQDGSAVIAGRASPGAEVDVLAGDKVIDRVTADRRGAWVSIPAEKLAAGDQTLSLAALKGDGEVVDSEDVVVVAVRESGTDAPIRAAEPPPPQPPADVISEAPPPQPAEVVPAAAPAEEPLAVLLPRDRAGQGRILQAPGRISSDGALTLLVVDYDLNGRVQLSGEAPPGAPIRVYVDNQPAAEVTAGDDGSWTTVLKDRLGAGTYTLRLDQLDRDGRPVARLETPFTRVDQPPKEGDVAVDYVIVQPGNSLWRIARRLAGKGMAYVHIYEANRAQIRNPDLIYPGQVFEVPSALGAAG